MRRGGDGFLWKIPGGGVFSRRGEGPGGCLQRIGDFLGGGAKYFFSGPKRPPRLRLTKTILNQGLPQEAVEHTNSNESSIHEGLHRNRHNLALLKGGSLFIYRWSYFACS